MKSIVFISLALSIFDRQYKNDQNWLKYKEDYDKSYLNKYEEIQRYSNFIENDEKIREHNEKFMNGEVDYEMGHNEFSDMSAEEFSNTYLNSMPITLEDYPLDVDNYSLPEADDELSYKKHCLPPLNQGGCGSCWAFAAAAQVEARLNMVKGFKSYLSPQYLLDCSRGGSCDGGQSNLAIEFMKKNGGVLHKKYPYKGKQQRCGVKGSIKLNIKRTVFNQINGDEEYMKKILKSKGPIVMYMYATANFMSYKGGVYSERSCPTRCPDINHAIVLVGYGTTKIRNQSVDYWLIKNSWGKWGENGYGRILRNRNMCNVGCFVIYADI